MLVRRWLILLIAAFGVCTSVDVQAQFFAVAKQDWVEAWAYDGRSETQMQSELRSDYQARLASIERVCHANEEQIAKLARAAESDMTRFFRDISRARLEIETHEAGKDQDLNAIWLIVGPFGEKIRQEGLFAEESLFQKVTRSTLSEEQLTLYETARRESLRRRRRVITRVNVAEIERTMPLLSEQREQLLKLLDAQELPDKLSKRKDPYVGYIKLVMAKKRDQRLGGFLDDRQMAVIDRYCERYAGW